MSRNPASTPSSQNGDAPMTRKRSVDNATPLELAATPSKRQRSSALQADAEPLDSVVEDSTDELAHENQGGVLPAEDDVDGTPTATPKRRGRPPKSAAPNGETPTPRKGRPPGVRTPQQPMQSGGFTPLKMAADRSARRKSIKAMIERTMADEESEDDKDEETLVRELYESSDEGGQTEASERATTAGERTEDEGATPKASEAEAQTPTKRKGGRRKRAKSPTPPRDLPAHEMYFLHNKPGRPKTSDNTLGSLALMTHEEYFDIIKGHEDRHKADIEYLESLHAESFQQWMFELRQGFNLCLYGYGSKRSLMLRFAKHLYTANSDLARHQILVVNGYAPTTTLKDVLVNIKGVLDPTNRIPQAPPATMTQSILSYLSTTDQNLTLLINSLDASPLRRPASQSILAQFAAHPQIQLVASTDTPDFSMLWDIGVRSHFNFVFHDATTFAPYAAELDVVDEVHELLGRKARRVNGREGVAFVLKSLPENAKNLFQLIVGECLIAMEVEEEDGGAGQESAGVEYKMVYNKAVEEFICTSEMAFRTLLKEFHDHQIITSRKDALGTELLSVPFRKEELEAMLEDLMS